MRESAPGHTNLHLRPQECIPECREEQRDMFIMKMDGKVSLDMPPGLKTRIVNRRRQQMKTVERMYLENNPMLLTYNSLTTDEMKKIK